MLFLPQIEWCHSKRYSYVAVIYRNLLFKNEDHNVHLFLVYVYRILGDNLQAHVIHVATAIQ